MMGAHTGGTMAFSIELELEDGGTVIYNNVVSYLVEENDPSDTESPDEVPEEGDEDREVVEEVDIDQEAEELIEQEQEKEEEETA